MTRQEIEALAEKYQAKAERAYRNYQESGITRYDREYQNYDDLAVALRTAAESADNEQERIGLRVALSDLAYAAKKLEPGNREAVEQFTKRVISEAVARGIVKEDIL